jgi:hypothetical protein
MQVQRAFQVLTERESRNTKVFLSSVLAAVVAAFVSAAAQDKVQVGTGPVQTTLPAEAAVFLALLSSGFLYLHWAFGARLLAATRDATLLLLFRQFGTTNLRWWLLAEADFAPVFAAMGGRATTALAIVVGGFPVWLFLPATLAWVAWCWLSAKGSIAAIPFLIYASITLSAVLWLLARRVFGGAGFQGDVANLDAEYLKATERLVASAQVQAADET